jgi:hypothetical protein
MTKTPKVTQLQLKLLAIALMTLDHIGGVMGRETLGTLYQPLRNVGRIAFPIYCFLLVEGFVHTGNYKQYLTAVAATALVSEPLYDYAMTGKLLEFSLQNPLLAVAIALAMLGIMGMLDSRTVVEKAIGRLLILLCAAFWVILCRTEYGLQTVVLAAIFYCFRERLFAKIALSVLACIANPLEPFALCGLIYYSGERNLKLPKYVFYCFYPVHLLLLAGLKLLLFS